MKPKLIYADYLPRGYNYIFYFYKDYQSKRPLSVFACKLSTRLSFTFMVYIYFLFAKMYVLISAVVFGLWWMLILKPPVAGTYSESNKSDSRELFITLSASLFS